MPTYIALVSFTDQGARAIKDSPQRAEAATALANEVGLTVKDIFWTSGAYDGLIVVDAPDEPAASAFFLALGKKGNIRTQTLRAYDRAEFEGLLARVE